jgi:hypothetical protein
MGRRWFIEELILDSNPDDRMLFPWARTRNTWAVTKIVVTMTWGWWGHQPPWSRERLLAGSTWDGISFLAHFTTMLRRLDFSKASVLFVSPAKVFAVNLQLEYLFLEMAVWLMLEMTNRVWSGKSKTCRTEIEMDGNKMEIVNSERVSIHLLNGIFISVY